MNAPAVADQHEKAHYCEFGAGNMSMEMYYTLSMQQRAAAEASGDHTHDAARNYSKDKKTPLMPKVTKQYNVVGGTMSVLAAVMTRTTSRRELLHLFECLAHRVDFEPLAMWFDTYPDDAKFLAAHFPNCQGPRCIDSTAT